MLAHQNSLTGRFADEKPSVERRGSLDKITKGSPFGQMLENVKRKAESVDLWCEDMQRDLPKKWEKHGDMIIFPQNTFTHKNWRYIGRDLWRIIAESLKVNRLGRKRTIDTESDRTPHVDILFGDNGWVEHVDERGIRYIYDASKRVFNIEKLKEMKRISEFNCGGEVIVDMYAGLGYFTFPFALNCQAKLVHAIDWDEDTVEALLRSCEANSCGDKVNIMQGDARRVCPTGVADRVYLGLVPSCHAHWLTASKALNPQGGIIHVHETIDTKAPRVIPVRQKKAPPPKLASVDEGKDDDAKENQQHHVPSTSTEDKKEEVKEVSNPPVEGEEGVEDRPRRKFSRSASIVEEMESRVFPSPMISDSFKDQWEKLPQPHRDFAIECATSITRFLNNIHLSDAMYYCTIANLTRLSTKKTIEHIVVDIVCSQDSATAARLIAKYTNENTAK